MSQPTDGYGVYEGFNQDLFPTTAFARLDEIAAAGFKVVLNAAAVNATTNTTQMLAYADHALSVGLKLIWPLHNQALWKTNTIAASFPALYAESGNLGVDATFTPWLINKLKGHAATWGWYVADEPLAADHAILLTHANIISGADATHPRLLVGGGPGTPANSFSKQTTALWDCCDVGGDDFYPIGNDQSIAWDLFSDAARNTQQFCNTNGIQSVFVTQIFSWQQIGGGPRVGLSPAEAPYPSFEQWSNLLAAAMANMAPRLVLFWDYSILKNADNFALHWAELQAAKNVRVQSPGMRPALVHTRDAFLRPTQAGTWGQAPSGERWTFPLAPGTSQILDFQGEATGYTGSNISIFGQRKAQDVVLKVRLAVSSTSGIVGFYLRYIDTSNYVKLDAFNSLVRVNVIVGGGSTILTPTLGAGFTPANTNLWFKIQALGNTYSVKIWNASIAEPAAWNFVATDGVGTATRAGQFGLYAFLNASTDKVFYESFVAYAIPPVAALRTLADPRLASPARVLVA